MHSLKQQFKQFLNKLVKADGEIVSENREEITQNLLEAIKSSQFPREVPRDPTPMPDPEDDDIEDKEERQTVQTNDSLPDDLTELSDDEVIDRVRQIEKRDETSPSLYENIPLIDNVVLGDLEDEFGKLGKLSITSMKNFETVEKLYRIQEELRKKLMSNLSMSTDSTHRRGSEVENMDLHDVDKTIVQKVSHSYFINRLMSKWRESRKEYKNRMVEEALEQIAKEAQKTFKIVSSVENSIPYEKMTSPDRKEVIRGFVNQLVSNGQKGQAAYPSKIPEILSNKRQKSDEADIQQYVDLPNIHVEMTDEGWNRLKYLKNMYYAYFMSYIEPSLTLQYFNQKTGKSPEYLEWRTDQIKENGLKRANLYLAFSIFGEALGKGANTFIGKYVAPPPKATKGEQPPRSTYMVLQRYMVDKESHPLASYPFEQALQATMGEFFMSDVGPESEDKNKVNQGLVSALIESYPCVLFPTNRQPYVGKIKEVYDFSLQAEQLLTTINDFESNLQKFGKYKNFNDSDHRIQKGIIKEYGFSTFALKDLQLSEKMNIIKNNIEAFKTGLFYLDFDENMKLDKNGTVEQIKSFLRKFSPSQQVRLLTDADIMNFLDNGIIGTKGQSKISEQPKPFEQLQEDMEKFVTAANDLHKQFNENEQTKLFQEYIPAVMQQEYGNDILDERLFKSSDPSKPYGWEAKKAREAKIQSKMQKLKISDPRWKPSIDTGDVNSTEKGVGNFFFAHTSTWRTETPGSVVMSFPGKVPQQLKAVVSDVRNNVKSLLTSVSNRLNGITNLGLRAVQPTGDEAHELGVDKDIKDEASLIIDPTKEEPRDDEDLKDIVTLLFERGVIPTEDLQYSIWDHMESEGTEPHKDTSHIYAFYDDIFGDPSFESVVNEVNGYNKLSREQNLPRRPQIGKDFLVYAFALYTFQKYPKREIMRDNLVFNQDMIYKLIAEIYKQINKLDIAANQVDYGMILSEINKNGVSGLLKQLIEKIKEGQFEGIKMSDARRSSAYSNKQRDAQRQQKKSSLGEKLKDPLYNPFGVVFNKTAISKIPTADNKRVSTNVAAVQNFEKFAREHPKEQSTTEGIARWIAHNFDKVEVGQRAQPGVPELVARIKQIRAELDSESITTDENEQAMSGSVVPSTFAGNTFQTPAPQQSPQQSSTQSSLTQSKIMKEMKHQIMKKLLK